MPFPTPRDLVAALGQGSPSALTELERRCRGPIQDLAREINARLGLGQNVNRLAEHTLRWSAMHLRVQDPARFEGLATTDDLSWVVFRQYVRWKAGQMLWGSVRPGPWLRRCPQWLKSVAGSFVRWLLPWTRRRRTVTISFPNSVDFAASVFSRPLDQVGGDWYAATCDGDTLWLLVADVCGKSWPAYILSQGLPFLWSCCLAAHPADPAGMLAHLDGHLQACLPEGLFVEGTVAKMVARPAGEAVVAAAGRSVVLRRDASRAMVIRHDLGGPYLGLGLAGPYDQTAWPLAVGDEMLLASDGLLDQPAGPQRLEAVLKPPSLSVLTAGRLHDTVVRLLQEALWDHAQHDDITVVTVRRR